MQRYWRAYGMLVLVSLLALALVAWELPQVANAERAAGEELLIGHITDEHMNASDPGLTNYNRLAGELHTMRLANVDLLLSTGDLTDMNDEGSYRLLNQALDAVGGFSNFPRFGAGIPFRSVAGNHDNYGLDRYVQFMGPARQSFTLGNYRFIGFSGNSTHGIPAAWLESEMAKSDVDGKPIVLFHHYPPPGWMVGQPDLDMSQASWETLNILAQRYPVIAYLAGHNHANRLGVCAPGFVLNTSAGTRIGHGALYVLNQGRVNIQPEAGRYVPMVITYPRQYFAGLDYTKTEAAVLQVRAYATVQEGHIVRVAYRLDGGTSVTMQRVGLSPYYEAELDARWLAGPHTIEVTAYHSYGAFATASHTITSYFAPIVPARSTPGPTPLTWLTLDAPAALTIETSYLFTVTVGPITATTPVTYAWTATGLATQTHTGRGLSDSASFAWPTAGAKTVGVTARNAAGQVVGSRNILLTLATWAPIRSWSTAFGTSTGWTSQEGFLRTLADVNGDSRADVVGFGATGTYVSLSSGTGLGAMTRWSTGFGSSAAAGSWISQTQYPRMLGDVNGDGKADIVGFGGAGAFVALAVPTGTLSVATSFGPMSRWTSSFGFLPAAGSWTSQDIYPRFVADVNGDGKTDIVGFGGAGVYVARSTGTGFAPMTRWRPSFGCLPTAGGWTSQSVYPRLLGDVNGDGKADIVGFGAAGAYVALSTGAAFSPMSATPWIRGYGASPAAGGWTSQNLYPRLLADVNGDGKADIVGFGAAGVYYSLSTGTGFGAMALGAGMFGSNPTAGRWTSQSTYPRFAADMDHDHKADLVGFGASGVYVGLYN